MTVLLFYTIIEVYTNFGMDSHKLRKFPTLEKRYFGSVHQKW